MSEQTMNSKAILQHMLEYGHAIGMHGRDWRKGYNDIIEYLNRAGNNSNFFAYFLQVWVNDIYRAGLKEDDNIIIQRINDLQRILNFINQMIDDGYIDLIPDAAFISICDIIQETRNMELSEHVISKVSTKALDYYNADAIEEEDTILGVIPVLHNIPDKDWKTIKLERPSIERHSPYSSGHGKRIKWIR